MYPEYDPNEPSLGQSWANMLRGFQNPQAYQEAGKSLQNALQLTPNVTESLGRGGVAQAIGTTGDLRDLRNTVQSYLPKSVQNWSNAAEFLTNPYAKALIQTAPTTEQTLDFVPRATAPYEGYKQHETMGEYIAPSLGYFGAKALKAGKDLPIGMTIQDVTPPIEPAKVAEALRQPEKNALGFYSPLDEAVMNLQNQKGTGQQYLAQLLKTQGVKQEEVATRGLDTFLTENPKVTKTQIEEFLGQNPVQLKETVLGVPEKFDADRLKQLETEYAGLKEHAIDDPSFGENKYNEMIRLQNIRDNSTLDSLYARAEADERTAQRMQQLGLKDEAEKYFRQAELLNTRAEKLDLEELGPVLPTKFGKPDFNIPNGENYREVLIQMPSSSALDIANKNLDNFWTQIHKEKPNADLYDLTPQELAKYDELNNIALKADKKAVEFVNRNHFEQPNILTHMRVDDRVIDGKKTLFIQEIQSDWHQAGRKQGYNEPKALAEIQKQRQILLDKKDYYSKLAEPYAAQGKDSPPEVVEGWTMAANGLQELDKKQSALGRAVPDAPFKNTEQWAGLAMKRAMQMAAEGGYDRIAFTTGKQQSDRYNLRKHIEEIHYEKLPDGRYSVTGKDKNGNVPLDDTYTESQLEDTIGKEITKKIVNNEGKKIGRMPEGKNVYSISGEGLEVGGEGMVDFYDKILPNYVNKYGKKNGIKVCKTKMRTSTDKQTAEDTYLLSELGHPDIKPTGFETVHYFDLTPQAKESFLKKGQPMFAVAPAMAITDEDSRREVLEKLFKNSGN
jgi:hypothetical protein